MQRQTNFEYYKQTLNNIYMEFLADHTGAQSDLLLAS